METLINKICSFIESGLAITKKMQNSQIKDKPTIGLDFDSGFVHSDLITGEMVIYPRYDVLFNPINSVNHLKDEQGFWDKVSFDLKFIEDLAPLNAVSIIHR